jgi:hypothetical protein
VYHGGADCDEYYTDYGGVFDILATRDTTSPHGAYVDCVFIARAKRIDAFDEIYLKASN